MDKYKIKDNFFPWTISHYITHPWKWIQDLKTMIAVKHKRSKWGWSHYDLWDFDHYLLTIVPNALEELANKSMGAPYGYEEAQWATFEEWQEEIRTLAAAMRLLTITDSTWEEATKFLWAPADGTKWDNYRFTADDAEKSAALNDDNFQRLIIERGLLKDKISIMINKTFDSWWD